MGVSGFLGFRVYKGFLGCFFGTLGPSSSRCGRAYLRHLQFNSMQQPAGPDASSDRPCTDYPASVNCSLKICMSITEALAKHMGLFSVD